MEHNIKWDQIKQIITEPKSNLEKLIRKVWSKPGVYLYISRKKIQYPLENKKPRIFYIGKSKNIYKRILHHFTIDMKEWLLNDRKCLSWTYQNYAERKEPFDLALIECKSQKEANDLETLLLAVFTEKNLFPPIANGTLNRKRLKSLSKDQEKLEYAKQLLEKYNK